MTTTIHAMTFGTKFRNVSFDLRPPNDPISACGATSFPRYHSFPKSAIRVVVVWDLSAQIASIYGQHESEAIWAEGTQTTTLINVANFC